MLVDGKPFLFGTCAIMKLCRELGLFGTILSFEGLISFILSVSMDISFLDVSFMDILQVCFIHLVSFLHLVFICNLVSVLEGLVHAYLLHVVSMACLLYLTQYIGKLHQVSNCMRCAWNSFPSLYAHIYVEFVLYNCF